MPEKEDLLAPKNVRPVQEPLLDEGGVVETEEKTVKLKPEDDDDDAELDLQELDTPIIDDSEISENEFGFDNVLHLQHSWSTIRENISSIAGQGVQEKAVVIGDITINDPDNPTEKEAWKVLEMLRKSEFFTNLPDASQKAILLEQERKAGKIHALDIITKKEKGEIVSDDDEYIEDRKQKEIEEEDNRLLYLWNRRDKRTNWIFLIIFHAVILINFIICLCESYRITIEHAHMDRMFLDDEFNCQDVINSGDTINGIFNILHAFFCVAVLFTDRLGTSNICWALIFSQLGHAMSDTFLFVYNLRVPTEGHFDDDWIAISCYTAFMIFELFSTLVVIQRYYDMTNILHKRTKGYTASIFGGRLLNEQIIYKNESSFLQKKYTLRQATSLQIYGIVQKIQHFKERGLEEDPKELQMDVKAAIAALKDVQSYEGTNLLKELRKRNIKRLKELKELNND